MSPTPPTWAAARVTRFPIIAAAIAALGGLLVLAGWFLDVPLLIRVSSGFAAMQPATALAFVASGTALFLLHAHAASPRRVLVGRGAVAATLLLATPSLFPALRVPGSEPMAPVTAVSFVLVGIALLGLRARPRLAASLAVAVGAAATLALIGYAYGVAALYALPWFSSMALHTAVLLFGLGIGVACAVPDTGLVRLLLADTAGGAFARHVLPPVVIVPIVFGWGVLRGAQLRGYDFEFGVALYALGVVAVLATVVWASARAMDEADARREAAEVARREDEERHRREAHFFRWVLDSLPDGVTASGADGRLLLHNRAAEAIVGLAPAGGSVADRIAAYDPRERDGTAVPAERFPINRALAGDTVEGHEILIARARPPAWVSVSASPLPDSDGRPAGAVAVFRDISEKRRMEAQLAAADRLAAMGILAAGIAHEINNPLAIVSGNLELVSRAATGTEREMVADAQVAAERIRQIVKDLRRLWRGGDDSLASVDVQAVLQWIVRVSMNEIRHRAVLEEDYQPIPRVYANEGLLSQVFLNLVVNATQAIPNGAEAADHRIRVRTGTAGGRAVVEVSDTGVGIAPDVRERLFTPFFTTKPMVGTGLGLAICHRVVTDLGGTIQVESEPGRGATFRVLLPPIEVPVPAEPAAPRLATPPPLHLLVVDDEVQITDIMKAALRPHRVEVRNRAADALALLASGEPFDLVLCDLMMPGMTGIELHEAVVARGIPVRMLFLTGGAFTPESMRFLATPGRRYLEKPFDLTTLRKAVADAVR